MASSGGFPKVDGARRLPAAVAGAIALLAIVLSGVAAVSGPGSELGEFFFPMWVLATLTVAPAPWVAARSASRVLPWLALVGVVITSAFMFFDATALSSSLDDVEEPGGASWPWLVAGVVAWLATWTVAATSLLRSPRGA